MYMQLEDWVLEWDTYCLPIRQQNTRDEDFHRALHLFRLYAGAYSVFPDLKRLFQGRWSQHGEIVNHVVYWHTYHGYGAYKGSDSVHSLLKHLSEKLPAEKINPKGDLAAILEVIKQKTGLDFFQLPEQSPTYWQRNAAPPAKSSRFVF